jgi:hypothetical protein
LSARRPWEALLSSVSHATAGRWPSVRCDEGPTPTAGRQTKHLAAPIAKADKCRAGNLRNVKPTRESVRRPPCWPAPSVIFDIVLVNCCNSQQRPRPVPTLPIYPQLQRY